MNTHKTGLSTRLLATVAMAFMLFPLLTVIPVSFTSKRYLSMPNGNWSLYVVDDFSECPKGWIGKVEIAQEHLERAQIAVVGEFGIEHVEA